MIGELCQPEMNRSAFIEQALWTVIHHMRRGAPNAQDAEMINRRADYLNAEVADVLAYPIA